jgi:hypothetical protein
MDVALRAPRAQGELRPTENGSLRKARMDNVGIVVESLDEAISFFAELGLKLEGRATIEGRVGSRARSQGSSGDRRLQAA